MALINEPDDAAQARTGGEALVDRLIAHGVDTVFLVPGIQLDWAVDALAREPSIRCLVPRHEQTVTYMADGYARTTGRPGVGMVVPGPGVLNAGAGLATAYACNSRVLLLAGQIHSEAIGKGFGNLHEIKSQSAVLRSLTKWSSPVGRRDQLSATVDAAFAQLDEGRPRPVAVELPYDILMARGAERAAPGRPAAAAAEPDARQVEAAARLIDAADFPVLYVGGGAHGAATEIRALAERSGIPVVASENGRGCLPDRHPLSFTTLAGRALFERADVVVVIGSRFMDVMAPQPSWEQEGKRYVYINLDAADATVPRRPEVFLECDAAAAVAALCACVKARQVMAPDRAQRLKRWEREAIEATGDLARYVFAIRAALPDDGIFVNELTQVGYLARVAFEVRAPRTLIGPGYQGTLGYSFPTALGAAVGGGGRRVFAITGDGGFGWSYQELATARRHDLPVTLIVFTDGYFGNVRGIQRRTFGREFAVDLQNPDFRTLADAFSIPYATVAGPAELEAVLRDTLRENGPVLVEAPVGEMASPWPLLGLKPLAGAGGIGSPPSDLF